jgi:dienelactone hydrolase
MFFLIPAVAYALYASGMYAEQMHMFFPGASDQHRAFQGDLPPDTSLAEIPVSFGKVRAIYTAPANSTQRGPVIIFSHGNFDRARDYASTFQPLAARGVGVLVLEFPGYDGADGAPNFDTLSEATTAAYDWLARQPSVDPARIAAMGYSIGGGVIADLSRRRALRALILISTYTSIADMANRYLLPGFLARLPYDTLACVRDFAGPVMVVHGTRDRVIPFVAGQQLAQASKHGTFVSFNCGHDDCDLAANIFASRLPEWLAANGILSPPFARN